VQAIITGATNGIGAALAQRLAVEGIDVTLVGRSDARLAAAAGRIRKAAPDIAVATERADLADMGEVRGLTARLAGGTPADIVISNAALIAPPEERTALGVPRTVAVNYLAPYVLLRSLADALRSRGARFIIVGADPVARGPMPDRPRRSLLRRPGPAR
jgi:NAD(P)-dependent dehydrogenase (short-subunit alcohol dehydrogenase family)